MFMEKEMNVVPRKETDWPTYLSVIFTRGSPLRLQGNGLNGLVFDPILALL